jgi:ubiquinone biosynthesis protein UbiJ
MKEFSRAVDALRYATDRLQARLDAMAAEARR